MDEQEAIEGLENEGFVKVYAHEDAADATYTDHAHERRCAHIVIRGSMTLVVQGKATELQPGDRLDIPAGATHSSTIGPEGCRYVFGE